MQTFVPSIGFMRSASQLDDARLGKQRLETLQILDSIENGTGYKHHPINDMWRGYEEALVLYGLACLHEWVVVRRHGDSTTSQLKSWMDDLGMSHREVTYGKSGNVTGVAAGQEIVVPPWIGNLWVHRSHRSNLIRKVPHMYGRMFPGTPLDMPYLWPKVDGRGGYQLYLSRADLPRLASGERVLPIGLELDESTREVTES